MKKLILGAVLAASAAAATLGVAGTASAHDWRDRGNHYGWNNNGYDWRHRQEWRERDAWRERHEAWLRAQRQREWTWRHHQNDRPWYWDR
jgi:hypothetical protein